MKSIMFILLFFSTFFNLYSQQIFTPIKKTSFYLSFKGLDTLQSKKDALERKVCSCSWGTYKILSDKYVLRISTELITKRLGNFYSIDLEKANSKWLVEILVYDNENSTLSNVCTDMFIGITPQASRSIYITKGKLLIGFTKPTNHQDQFDVTVLLKEVVFIDPVSKNTITFKDVVIWKVFYDGIPG